MTFMKRIHPAAELTQNIQLSFHSISAKQGHFHTVTEYIASEHKVEYRTWGAKQRAFGLLPPKTTQSRSVLDIPDEITTEAALRNYVRAHKPYWLR